MSLRPMVTELVSSARQLYEESCELLRDKAHNLVNRLNFAVICVYVNKFNQINIYLFSAYVYNAEITRGLGKQVIHGASQYGAGITKVYLWRGRHGTGLYAKHPCGWSGIVPSYVLCNAVRNQFFKNTSYEINSRFCHVFSALW